MMGNNNNSWGIQTGSRLVLPKLLGAGQPTPITLIFDAPNVTGTLGGNFFNGHLRIVATSTTSNSYLGVLGVFFNEPLTTAIATINGSTTAVLNNFLSEPLFFSNQTFNGIPFPSGGVGNLIGATIGISNNFFSTYQLDKPAGPITGPLFFIVENPLSTDMGDLVITGVTGNGTFQVLGPIPCLHPDTMVQCKDNLKPISEIRAGDIVINHKGKSVSVLFNMRFGSSKEFVCIQKDALGQNLPTNDLIIRKSHPILVNGKIVKPSRLIKDFSGVKHVRMSSEVPVWSLCTEDKHFIVMQGVPVATWTESEIESQKQFHFTKF